MNEEATVGVNKVLCLHGEVLSAQVEWSGGSVKDSQILSIDNSDTPIDELTSSCFECECMIDLIKQNAEPHLLFSSVSERFKFVSLTVTGYYLPNSFDLFLKSLECAGNPNWFLSILLIRNVSESDAGDYEFAVKSNFSTLSHRRNFTLSTSKK